VWVSLVQDCWPEVQKGDLKSIETLLPSDIWLHHDSAGVPTDEREGITQAFRRVKSALGAGDKETALNALKDVLRRCSQVEP